MDGRLLTVLVVDDEPLVRHTIEAGLKRNGYQVLQAADGDEALSMVETSHVNLVLMDLVMPEREGLETIVELRRRFPCVKVIALSGAFGGQFLQVAQRLGADAILGKPVRSDVLRRTVEAVLAASAPPPATIDDVPFLRSKLVAE